MKHDIISLFLIGIVYFFAGFSFLVIPFNTLVLISYYIISGIVLLIKIINTLNAFIFKKNIIEKILNIILLTGAITLSILAIITKNKSYLLSISILCFLPPVYKLFVEKNKKRIFRVETANILVGTICILLFTELSAKITFTLIGLIFVITGLIYVICSFILSMCNDAMKDSKKCQ